MITPSENGISKDGSQYYGSAEYYSEKNDIGAVVNKHAPMQWVGQGAELLGLPTEIRTKEDLKVFDDLIKGKLPDGREMPQIVNNGNERRRGEDFVASAPKSVSIMATYGGDERILEAHNRAVLRTVEKIQERMMAVRGMVDGKQERVDGAFVVALAQHLDARPVDGFVAADVHTHMLFMNVAIRTSDGELRAVDWQREPGWEKEINAIYLSELASELRQLGYDLYKTKDAFEIVGIDRQMIEDFSPRLKAINKELEKMGLTRANATSDQKQAAAFKIREDKTHVTHEEMLAQGYKLVLEKGYDFQSVKDAALINERHENHEQRMDFAAESLKSAARHFSERQSVFEAKEVIKNALSVGLPKGVTEREIKQAWIERKDKHGLLTAKSPIDPRTGEASKERWITTSLALSRDEKMIKNLQAGKGAIAASERWTPQEIQREISAYETQKGFRLSPDQVLAINTTLGSGDRNTTWQGVAGAGKTTAVEVIKNAFENRGYKVLGIASGTQAVKELAGIGVECKTFASWTAGGVKADDKTAFIGDEIGMTGSADGARIVAAIEQNKSRGLFIGDTRQLQAVDSGSPFRIMQKQCDTSTLSEIRRQKNPEMLKIAELFSQGKAAEASQEMGQFMKAVDIGDAADYKEIDQKIADVVAKEYLSLPSGKPTENDQGVPTQTRENTLLIVATNAMREKLNTGIREGLKAEGSLGREDVQARTLHDEKATKEELRQAHYYDGKMKGEDGKAVQIVIIPNPDKSDGYAIHGVKFADEAIQKHYLEMRAFIAKQGEEFKKDMPFVLEKGQEYRIQSVDLQKGEVRLTDKENREIIWRPDEAGKVKAYEEKQTDMAVNDKVIFKQNQDIRQPDGKEMKVFNGQKGVVQAISENKIHIKTSTGEDVAIDKNGGTRIEHAYCGTVHSMQGTTQDYGIAALRAGSKINTANQGYVGQTRFRYEIKVHTNNVEQLQKDWGKGYQYQENAIDHANSKDLKQHNQQHEEKEMEVTEKEDGNSSEKEVTAHPQQQEEKKMDSSVEKEDSLNPKNPAQVEPEKGPAVHSEKEVTDGSEKAQPEAQPAAPGKDAEREAPEGAPRDPEQRQAEPEKSAPVWDASVPAHGQDVPETEKAAERATDSAREPIWDENVPAATGEHEYAGGPNPEPSPAHEHGQQERMDDAMKGPEPKHEKQEIMAPPAKADTIDWAAAAETDKAMAEREYTLRASVGWYENRPPNDRDEIVPAGLADIEKTLSQEWGETYEQIHERMEKDRAINPDTHPDPYLPQKEAQGQEQKGEHANPAPGKDERATQSIPPGDLAKWARGQEEQERNAHNAKVMAEMAGKRPEHVHEAGRDASSMEARLGKGGSVQAQHGIRINQPAKEPKGKDKPMEREM